VLQARWPFHYTTEELRHQLLNLLVLAGIDMVLVRRTAGHKKASITLDVYGHVRLDEPEERLAALRRGVAGGVGTVGPGAREGGIPCSGAPSRGGGGYRTRLM
jgi:hypothetical protein